MHYNNSVVKNETQNIILWFEGMCTISRVCQPLVTEICNKNIHYILFTSSKNKYMVDFRECNRL